jgi:hypothetical protein
MLDLAEKNYYPCGHIGVVVRSHVNKWAHLFTFMQSLQLDISNLLQ